MRSSPGSWSWRGRGTRGSAAEAGAKRGGKAREAGARAPASLPAEVPYFFAADLRAAFLAVLRPAFFAVLLRAELLRADFLAPDFAVRFAGDLRAEPFFAVFFAALRALFLAAIVELSMKWSGVLSTGPPVDRRDGGERRSAPTATQRPWTPDR